MVEVKENITENNGPFQNCLIFSQRKFFEKLILPPSCVRISKSGLQTKRNIRIPNDGVNHFPIRIAWQDQPPFGDKLTDVYKICQSAEKCNSFIKKEQDKMPHLKPIRAIKLTVNVKSTNSVS